MISPHYPASHPVPPQGFWLAEPAGTATAGGAHLFSLPHGRRGCLCCAVAVAVGVGAGSSGLSSEDPLSLPPVTPENGDRITSFAKKFFPSIGTIMICSLSDNLSATIFWISMGFDFKTDASNFMRSESAAAVTRIRLASASAVTRMRSEE